MFLYRLRILKYYKYTIIKNSLKSLMALSTKTIFFFGCLDKPTHLKWNHPKHDSQNMDGSLWRSCWHTPHVHTDFSFFWRNTSSMIIHASHEKYLRIKYTSTFSSSTAFVIRSGLHSTSVYSIIAPLLAESVIVLLTNQLNITKRKKRN